METPTTGEIYVKGYEAGHKVGFWSGAMFGCIVTGVCLLLVALFS